MHFPFPWEGSCQEGVVAIVRSLDRCQNVARVDYSQWKSQAFPRLGSTKGSVMTTVHLEVYGAHSPFLSYMPPRLVVSHSNWAGLLFVNLFVCFQARMLEKKQQKNKFSRSESAVFNCGLQCVNIALHWPDSILQLSALHTLLFQRFKFLKIWIQQ